MNDAETVAPHLVGRTAASRATRTAIATVCLSGTIEDKLAAAAAAGFDGIEIFEPDLIASSLPPAAIRERCADLGLSIELYQPFRDLDSVEPARAAANLHRLERKLDVMEQLGVELLLVCSSVADDAVPDDDELARQLSHAADRAAARGMRLAYEALAWGTHVATYEHSWNVVRRAGHPALGLCLDSFHILARGSDIRGIRDIPSDKLFFLQLADAPILDMGVLEWSRHHRLFPGQGEWDLPTFVHDVLVGGYSGPLSLEVFNDVFRQSDPRRTAVDARRSLLILQDAVAQRESSSGVTPPRRVTTPLPVAPGPSGFAFAEIAVDGTCGPHVANALHALGFTYSGHHRTKPVALWTQGSARVLLNTGTGDQGGTVSSLGIETPDPDATAARARALLAPDIPRTRGPAEADLTAVSAPDGTGLFFCRTGSGGDWTGDFAASGQPVEPGIGITHVDHVGLTQPFDHVDEAALFYRSLFGLQRRTTSEVAAPFGLVRSCQIGVPGHPLRIVQSVPRLRRGDWAPDVQRPQYIAFACADVVAAARTAQERGAPLLAIPDNYYDDLDARLAPSPELLATMRELSILYDQDEDGAYLQVHTELLGGAVFFVLVQRLGAYAGHGARDAYVRMAAHRRARRARQAREVSSGQSCC